MIRLIRKFKCKPNLKLNPYNQYYSQYDNKYLKILRTHNISQFSQQKSPQNDNKTKHQSSQQWTDSYKYKLILRYLALGVFGGLLGYYLFGNQQENIKEIEVLPHQPLKIGGQWQLINTQGKYVSSSDLKGSYYIIYFGFTKCPDICPNTLRSIATMKRFIEDDPDGKTIPLKVVFVSLDPQRDSPQQMKRFLFQFDPNILGLTGVDSNDSKLTQIKKRFKIYSSKISRQQSYVIDHTTIIYLMDKQNNFLDVINPSLSQKQSSILLIKKILSVQKQRRQNIK